jgi:hypothetical protein
VIAATAVWRLPLAAACISALPAPFEIDPALRAVDTVPPSTFRALHSTTRQISATRCSGKTCTSSSCGDSGTLELTFDPPEDDQNEASELGYRVLWLGGTMPGGLRPAIERVQPLLDERRIVIELGFSGVAELDGELALVAVDRAGNESQPSDALRVRFSGCMTYFDAPNTCEASPHGCSVSGPVGGAERAASWLPLAAAAVLGWLARARLRVRQPPVRRATAGTVPVCASLRKPKHPA